MGILQDKAVLVRLAIRQWTARKMDKGATAELHESKNAQAEAGVYYKQLVDKQVLKKAQEIATQARDFHYKTTLPWDGEGLAILVSKMMPKHQSEMNVLGPRFISVVEDELIPEYANRVDLERVRLGRLWNPGDYPPPHRVRSKFSFKVEYFPIPDAGDFRVSLQNDEIEKMRKQLEEGNERRLREAMNDIWVRLHKVVKHMADSLSKDDKIFRDSLVGNVLEAVEILPGLNIADDPALDAMISEVRQT